MENKLTLEHLAPYLGTNLKFQYVFITITKKIENRIGICNGFRKMYFTEEALIDNNANNPQWMDLRLIKPILRPLSDLTNDEKIEFHNKFRNSNSDNILPNIPCGKITNWHLSMGSIEMYNWLLSKHFDIHGLIEKGLAIDINNLKE